MTETSLSQAAALVARARATEDPEVVAELIAQVRGLYQAQPSPALAQSLAEAYFLLPGLDESPRNVQVALAEISALYARHRTAEIAHWLAQTWVIVLLGAATAAETLPAVQQLQRLFQSHPTAEQADCLGYGLLLHTVELADSATSPPH
ncbi:hypothetical protein [Buchananella hordeovulneris]|uniref:hypothetical protein n=1 Tax=Buchananella hordeovulneris TaxID=52770 RepID=UPI000F5F1F3A|nr:hypothetical protein [Buchananella hordeovulneris]RRD45480.1 hypothetical protein EII13_01040 [Buchananella hordeovulneris]